MKKVASTSKNHSSTDSVLFEQTLYSYEKKNKEVYAQLREHEFMLSDKSRIDSYYDAISKYINPGDSVIDLGTGTGILAFFAVKSGAKKVYAIDHSDIIHVAERVAKYNKIYNIEFINKNSTEFFIDSPVDVIIHEQMGNFLIDEYMIENICDLRDRCLKEGGRILPDKFELYIEPIKANDSQHIPMIREMKIHGIDFSCIEENGPEELYSFLWRSDPNAVDYFLCDPEPVYKLDLQTITPETVPSSFNYSRVVRNRGRLDGFIVYFKAYFDDEIILTSGPFENRGTNWKYYLLRMESRQLEAGDTINFSLKAENIKSPKTWFWEIN